MHSAAFDLTTASRDDLSRRCSGDGLSGQLAHPRPPGDAARGVYQPVRAPPEDTGEAMDLPPSGLPSLRLRAVAVRWTRASPATALAWRPAPRRAHRAAGLPGDDLILAFWTAILVPPCADDPQVAIHAIRNLTRRRSARRSRRVGPAWGLAAPRPRPQRNDDPTKFHGLQGRHREHHGRGGGRTRPARLGASRRRRGPPAGWRAARTWSPGASG